MKLMFVMILLLLSGGAVQASGSLSETLRKDLSSGSGIHWQFQPENGSWKDIQVPAGGWRTQGYTCDAGTYRADIPIPNEAAGHAVSIVFEAINFGADISAGPDAAHMAPVAAHVDGWMPVSADVTRLAIPGRLLHLVVAVAGRGKFRVNGKYTVPEGATWDPYIEEGILRGVHLVISPSVYVSDAFVQTDVAAQKLHAQVTITNTQRVPVTLAVQSDLSAVGGGHFTYPKLKNVTVTVPPGARTTLPLQTVSWTLGPRSYWWPNVPYKSGYRAQLHQLNITLLTGGTPLHHYRQRFGFRQFQVRGNHYFLNGVRCNLRGDNQQEADFGTDGYGVKPGFGPRSAGNAGWPQAVDNLQRLNFNLVRIHQIPATPYMLDVCDAMGLMLIEESPLRGSEGGEDYTHGRDNMLNMDRELVLRDRNHPATIIWSAANEWSDPIKDAVPVIKAVDATRPIIADGVGDLGFPYINIQHYCDGLGALSQHGGTPRADRPYGEGEAIWPADSSLRGFAWMATGTRLRRLQRNDDIRNYVLNNAWPNYVPGESPETEVLEAYVKGDKDAKILPSIADPWHNANIRLLQQCYAPVCVCDVDFDQDNKRSNRHGDWPVTASRLDPNASVTRTLAVFNDEFSGEQIRIRWTVHQSTPDGAALASGQTDLHVPLGEMTTLPITFRTPASGVRLCLSLTASKQGKVCFAESAIAYRVAPSDAALFPDGDYLLLNGNSGLSAAAGTYQGLQALVQQPPHAAAVWHLKNVGGGQVTLTDADGLVLGIADASDDNGALARTEPPRPGAASQIWHLTPLDATDCTLSNVESGKLLDVYAASKEPGGRVAQWTATGGQNQEWELQPVAAVGGK